MSVESLIKPAEADSKVIITSYEEYVGKGGILDPESFRMLESFSGLDTSNINPRCLEAARGQVKNMASLAKVRLSQREEEMYILLRSLPKDICSTNSGRRAQVLNDQPLLAEILLVTDPAKHDKFVNKCKNYSTRSVGDLYAL